MATLQNEGELPTPPSPLLGSPIPHCASRGRRAAYPPTLFGAYAWPAASLSPCARPRLAQAIFEFSIRAHWDDMQTQWFVYVDDDTYVLHEPLLDLLSRYDPRAAHYLGRPLQAT